MDRPHEKEHLAAVRLIRTILEMFAEEKHAPDRWERAYLAEAIAALHKGLYEVATAGASLALAPVEERLPLSQLPNDLESDKFSLLVLRDALEEADAQFNKRVL